MGPIEAFLTADHARLDALLSGALIGDAIHGERYEEFRRGLLRHIGMEEKILLPFARAKRNGEPLEIARALRIDHGVLAKLLVPTPTPALVARLREELARHNRLEEGDGALYAICDALAGSEAEAVVASLRNAPEVPTAKHYDGPLLK
ncbi:MAG: hemerythrin domain-containing protein [Polyangiaceae bacterium]